MKPRTYEVWIGEEIGDMKTFCNFFTDREEAIELCKNLSCYNWEVAFVVDGPTLDYSEEGVYMKDRWEAI